MVYDYVIGMDVGKYFHHACERVKLFVCGDDFLEVLDLTPFWWTPGIQPGWVGKIGNLPSCPGTKNSSDTMLWLSMRTLGTSR